MTIIFWNFEIWRTFGRHLNFIYYIILGEYDDIFSQSKYYSRKDDNDKWVAMIRIINVFISPPNNI
jgi:hypothetical protein